MRVFFAGAESKDHLQLLLDTGARNVLMTYFYLREKKLDLKAFKEQYPDINIMLDSGTFSFRMNAQRKGIKLKKEDLEAYLYEYLPFIEKNAPYIYNAVELDVYGLIDNETIYGWEKKYFMPLDKYVPIVYVWQRRMGNYKMLDMLDGRFRYVGIGGYGGGIYDDMRRRYVIEANKAGIRTHGFALTRFKALRSMPFHSVDSSTWLGAARWGMCFVYKPGVGITMFDKNNKWQRKRFRSFYEEAGADFKGVMEDKPMEVLKGNVLAILKENDDINKWMEKTGIGGPRYGTPLIGGEPKWK